MFQRKNQEKKTGSKNSANNDSEKEIHEKSKSQVESGGRMTAGMQKKKIQRKNQGKNQ